MTTEPEKDEPDALELPPVVRITPEEVARAVPPPPRPRFGQPAIPAPPPSALRTSKLAVAGFILGIVSVPILGVITGPIAVLFSALGIAAVHSDADLRGMKRAVTGLVLGVFALLIWTIGLWVWFGKAASRRADHRPPETLVAAGGPPPAEIRNSAEPYRTALLANVVIMGAHGDSSWSGSGVVIDRDGKTLRILTNRHVSAGTGGFVGQPSLWVLLSSGETVRAEPAWQAPGEIDLSIVETKPDRSTDVPVIPIERGAVAIAQDIFAVGNPLEFRWTLTKGSISSVREIETSGEKMKVYQIQAPINAGNSGGGLYTAEGRLIGINTWTTNKSVSEGLGFSISIETFLELLGRSSLDWAKRLHDRAGNR